MPNNAFSPDAQARWLFGGYAAIVLLSILLGIALETYFLVGLPVLVMVVYIALVDFQKLFWLLLISIPLSIEVALPGGLGTDLPIEPLILGLLGIYVIWLLQNPKAVNGRFLTHPLTLILLLHFSWTVVSAIVSEVPLVSVKYSLAKFWYIAIFFFLAGRMLQTEADIKTFFWCVFIPLVLTIFWVTAKHSLYSFSFAKVNAASGPFYRNHVAYSAILACFIPMVWYVRRLYPKGSRLRTWLGWSLMLMLMGIQLSYTRAAYVAVILAAGTYLVLRLRLMKIALLLSFVFLTGIAYFLANDNRYLDFSPDFERTVTHYEFDNLVEATFKMEDISTVERFYRWIAGSYLFAEYPWMGVGPGNFYNFYHGYTVRSYKTYVSNNPEKSGIHCYYLMMLVEQGVFGFLIFLLLTVYALIKGEVIYHQTRVPWRRSVVLFAVMSLVAINALCLINDLIETDKVGSFYFINLALLVNIDLANRQDERNATQPDR